MKKSLLFLLVMLVCFITACNKKQLQKKPENLIPIDKMTAIFSDILLIENTINMAPVDSNRERMMNMYYSHLFQYHNITKEQFQKSIDYYLSNENDVTKIFDAVNVELQNIEKEYLEENESDNDERIIIES